MPRASSFCLGTLRLSGPSGFDQSTKRPKVYTDPSGSACLPRTRKATQLCRLSEPQSVLVSIEWLPWPAGRCARPKTKALRYYHGKIAPAWQILRFEAEILDANLSARVLRLLSQEKADGVSKQLFLVSKRPS